MGSTEAVGEQKSNIGRKGRCRDKSRPASLKYVLQKLMSLHPDHPRRTAKSGVSYGSFIAKCNQIPTPVFLEDRRPQFNPRYMKKTLVTGLFFRFILTKALFKHITV